MNTDFSKYSGFTQLARTISHNDFFISGCVFFIKLSLKHMQSLGRKVYEAIDKRVSTVLLKLSSVKS